ncbi:T6SS phospholipase effector Tle1-like catalytic domain-containing protein [Rhizobium leguminosarum]|nr:DUF2235 domain-containing protein [Rhizobium leguminosarum bv. trifolii]
MGRHLICLIDGTRVSANQTREYMGYSNVYELGYMLKLKDRSGEDRPQIVFYSSGISSQPDAKDLLSAATGRTIRAQILDQYTNLCSNYDFAHHDNPGQRDKIYLFGFSRGAMTARAVAGLIMEYGLLRPQHVRYAPQIVEDWERWQPRPGYVTLVPVDVEFMGVFDCVMGGIDGMRMFNPISFPHTNLSERCRCGIHLLAIDEDRVLFKNRSWRLHKAGNGIMKQIWMPGVHSDIGGTGNEFWGRLSLLTMTYFIDKQTALRLDTDWLEERKEALRQDFRNETYAIRRQRIPPFSVHRRPNGNAVACEEAHPIVDRLTAEFEVYGKRQISWRDKVFAPNFGKLTKDPGLQTFFNEIL